MRPRTQYPARSGRASGCVEARLTFGGWEDSNMGWRIYLWIVGVIALVAHAPSFIEPSHPAVAALALATLASAALVAAQAAS